MPTPQPAVSFPTEVEIARIAAMTDPTARNLEITQAYWRLSVEAGRRLPGGANWCTYATWASRQAGVTIRHEDLVEALQERLQASWKISRLDTLLIEALEHDALDVLQLVINSLSKLGPLLRSGTAVGQGNLKVFAEIGLLFARWLAAFPDPGAATGAAWNAFCATLRSGPPPDGQDLLCAAFANYGAAARATDPRERAQRQLLANLQIGNHEQIRLQPDILDALNGALIEPQDLADLLLQVLKPGEGAVAHGLNRAWPFGKTPLERIALDLAQDVHLEVRALITATLMSLWLPPADVVELGHDLTHPFPANLTPLTDPALLALLAGFDPTPNSESGSGTRDWGNFPQRMRFITDLFCAYAEEPALFRAPVAGGAAATAS